MLPCLAALASSGCGDAPAPRPPASATATLQALDSIERLLDAGRTGEALRAAESLQRSLPEDAMAAEMLGRALLASGGSPDRVADAYARAADLRPDSPGLQSVAGITAAAAGRLEPALARQRRAGELEPGNPQHALQEATVLRALHRPAEALAQAQRAVALAPAEPAVQLCLSRCLADQGDLPGGRAAARRALEANPRDAALRAAVARALIEQQAAVEAVTVLQVEADRPAASKDTLECLAAAQSAADMHALAAATWQRVASMPMASWQPCLRASACLLQAGDRTQALEWLARARERRAPEAETASLESQLAAPSTSAK